MRRCGGLTQELELTQARLRTMREESDAANQELRAANEELQSINEEYRSTSEELETSKEELQSINEELQTVNSELKLQTGSDFPRSQRLAEPDRRDRFRHAVPRFRLADQAIYRPGHGAVQHHAG